MHPLSPRARGVFVLRRESVPWCGAAERALLQALALLRRELGIGGLGVAQLAGRFGGIELGDHLVVENGLVAVEKGLVFLRQLVTFPDIGFVVFIGYRAVGAIGDGVFDLLKFFLVGGGRFGLEPPLLADLGVQGGDQRAFFGLLDCR